MRSLLLLPTALLVVGMCAGVEGMQRWHKLQDSLPPAMTIANTRPALTTRILSRDGHLIATLFDENRTWTPLEKIAPAVTQAVIAIEDRRFYEHDGVDTWGIIRAAWSNWRGKGIQEGASTLTMQLVRNVLKDKQRTYDRKLREAALAWDLEKRLGKKRILEMYLNQVYFGHGCYGIASAARYYFGKPPGRLQTSEAAWLAALPQSPEYLSDPAHRRAWKARQLEVLRAMFEQGKFPYRKYRAVLSYTRHHGVPKRHYGGNQPLLRYPYFTSFVIRQLARKFDHETLYRGGLTIRTSLDVRAQKIAESVVRSTLERQGWAYNAGQAALVSLDNKTGEIKAMVGGRRWSVGDQFNRAWQARRQAGSTFKAFLYATALEKGISMRASIPDAPTKFRVGNTVWAPQNSDGRYLGPLPMWKALMLSRNACSANLIARVGPAAVLHRVRRLGMARNVGPNLSLALGAVDVSPLQLAAGFSTLLNRGVYREPQSILCVTDAHGRVIYRPKQLKRRVFTVRSSRTITYMLQNVVKGGTGTAAQIPGQAVAGKTGTSDRCKDAWFAGFTPTWTTCVWVGNDNQQPTYGCFGGTLPAQIWRNFMTSAAPRSPLQQFALPPQPQQYARNSGGSRSAGYSRRMENGTAAYSNVGFANLR